MLGRALSLEKGAKLGNCMRQATLPTPSESWIFAIFSPQLLVSNIYIYIYIYIFLLALFLTPFLNRSCCKILVGLRLLYPDNHHSKKGMILKD